MNTTTPKAKADMFGSNALHIMIDIETGGLQATSAIFQIAAVPFALQSGPFTDFFNEFDEKIYPTSVQDDWGTDEETMAWWAEQSQEVKDIVFSGTQDLLEALEKLSVYLTELAKEGYELFVWGNGSDFDIAQLFYFFKFYEIEVPWKYSNVRCFRTLKNLYPNEYEVAKQDIAMNGLAHDALADATWQAKVASRILNGVMPLSAAKLPEAP